MLGIQSRKVTQVRLSESSPWVRIDVLQRLIQDAENGGYIFDYNYRDACDDPCYSLQLIWGLADLDILGHYEDEMYFEGPKWHEFVEFVKANSPD